MYSAKYKKIRNFMSLSDAYCQSGFMDVLSMQALENLWQIRKVLGLFQQAEIYVQKN